MKHEAGSSRLADLYQQGSARIRFPAAAAAPGEDLEAVFINTAGGLTGGDRFDWTVDVAPGARCTVLTQACEKVYRSRGDTAHVAVSLTVGDQGRLDWLPQETILFEGARIARTFEVDLARGARLLAAEAVILGRKAMGETAQDIELHDRWRVRRGGRLLFADDVRLTGPLSERTGRGALLDGAGAYAAVLLADPDAEDRLDAARAALGDGGGASAFDGKLFCRILAADGMALRKLLIPLLQALRQGAPLPRLWTV